MNNLEFRAWDKDNKQMYFVGDAFGTSHPYEPLIYKKQGQNVEVIQYTGTEDLYNTKIYFGDILNICFTSSYGEHIHDGVYVAEKDVLGGLSFRFIRLLWQSYGHNQHPISNTLCEKYGGLGAVYDNERNRHMLIATTDKYTNEPVTRYPFNEEKALSFCSRYFEIIGNIYENPDFLEENLI